MHSYAMMSDVTNGYCLSQGTNDWCTISFDCDLW
jgi:hypothetical protein